MDAKSAREIIKAEIDITGLRYLQAEGYLDCLENGPEVKALVEALQIGLNVIVKYVPEENLNPQALAIISMALRPFKRRKRNDERPRSLRTL